MAPTHFSASCGEGRETRRVSPPMPMPDTEGLVAMLLRHLEDEEDLIVPVILDRGEASLGLM
jgi:hypothetical protein